MKYNLEDKEKMKIIKEKNTLIIEKQINDIKQKLSLQ